MRSMRRLIFRSFSTSYRALAFEFKDDKDGSFYIETSSANAPDGSGGNTQRVSYHATGRINYKGPIDTTTYGEPIFAISQPHLLFCVSFAELNKLSRVTDSRADDVLLDVALPDGERISLYVWITPPDALLLNPNALVVAYAEWFAIQIVPGPPPLANIELNKNRVTAPAGVFNGQQVSQEQALIFVHQKRTGVKDMLCWWETSEKPCFRLIFAVPMRVPPKLDVIFKASGLEVVSLQPCIRNTATAELRFRVRGKGGFLTEPPAIERIILDAELH